MKKNRGIIILVGILLILISIIISLFVIIDKKSMFIEPSFDENVSVIPENLDYKSSVIEVSEGYNIYINPVPSIEDNKLVINFISIKDNNIWIKIRILNDNEEIVGESGLVKPGEYLKSVILNKKINGNDNIVYEIIGYEIDSYLSAGTIKLNTKVGA